MDGSGSGLLNPDTDRRKNPDPSGSGSETLLSSEFLSSNIYPILTCVDPNPQSSWIRIQFGSGSTTLIVSLGVAGLECPTILAHLQRVPEGWMCRQCGYFNKIRLRNGISDGRRICNTKGYRWLQWLEVKSYHYVCIYLSEYGTGTGYICSNLLTLIVK